MQYGKLIGLEIDSFRGCPHHLEVDLRAKDSKGHLAPASLLIYGDNGSGKSTLVDAVELAFSGVVRRYRRGGISAPPRLASAQGKHGFHVKAKLASGEELHASGPPWNQQGLDQGMTRPSPIVCRMPFVLRRSEVLSFLETKNTERFMLFWNFAAGAMGQGLPAEGPSVEEWNRLELLESQRASLSARLEKKRITLAKLLDVDLKSVPAGRKSFPKFREKLDDNRRASAISDEVFWLIIELRRVKKSVRAIMKPYTAARKRQAIGSIKDLLSKVSEEIRKLYLELQKPMTIKDIALV